MNYLCKLLLLWSYLSCLLATPAQVQEAGHGQAALHHHPPQDHLLHEKCYSTWHMPDNPSVSCCNEADCYPPEVQVCRWRALREAQRGREVHSRSTSKGRAEQRQSRWQKPPLRAPARRGLPPIRYRLLLCIGGCHMRFVLVNAGRPASNLSVCCAVSQSGRAICENSGRGSHTAIIIATPITAKSVMALENHARAS
jgi:hypothetical protein